MERRCPPSQPGGLFFPSRRKLSWTFLVLAAAAATILLRMIPVQYDILDLREVPGFVMALFLGLPIRLFDAVTGGRFGSKGEGFLVYPSEAELLAALIIDIAATYVVVCILLRLRDGRAGDASEGSTPEGRR